MFSNFSFAITVVYMVSGLGVVLKYDANVEAGKRAREMAKSPICNGKSDICFQEG